MAIKGAEAHLRRLESLRANRLDMVIDPKMLEVAEAVRDDARNSIRIGAISGPGHIPSLPGEPPNADTHTLDNSIVVEPSATGKSIRVIARAIYSAALEFGTSRIAERPFMRPAAQRNRHRFVTAMAQAVSGLVRVKKG